MLLGGFGLWAESWVSSQILGEGGVRERGVNGQNQSASFGAAGSVDSGSVLGRFFVTSTCIVTFCAAACAMSSELSEEI